MWERFTCGSEVVVSSVCQRDGREIQYLSSEFQNNDSISVTIRAVKDEQPTTIGLEVVEA